MRGTPPAVLVGEEPAVGRVDCDYCANEVQSQRNHEVWGIPSKDQGDPTE